MARKHHTFAGRNNGPARQRYWASNILREHKVKNLMRHAKMTRAEATVHWMKVRTKRIKTK